MVTKGARTIAEYAIRSFLNREGFVMECFDLSMDGNEGTLTDKNEDSMVLVYNAEERSVQVKE
ncbi:hypothetical protein D7X48_18105 [bacterium D16-50]|nr:hypothetical protein D7X48_18105 [bacterium D16-50]